MKKRLIVFAILFQMFLACRTSKPGYSPEDIERYRYTPPADYNDGLQTASIDQRHIKKEVLENGVRAVMRGDYPNIHSILVASQGKLVFEKYFSGYSFKGSWTAFDYKTLHTMQSVTKSITALFFGTAVENGNIPNINVTVNSFYAEYPELHRGGKEKITVNDLLTMQSGFSWNEWEKSYQDQSNDINRFYKRKDPFEYLFQKDLAAEPGTAFSYNSGTANLLGSLLSRAAGESVDEYSKSNFFTPLGITHIEWERYGPSFISTSGGLHIRPRDAVKIGNLILNNGVYQQHAVISENWIKAVFHPSVHVNDEWDYGFLWVLPKMYLPGTKQKLKCYMAGGFGGQYLLVFPERRLVLVMTGGSYKTEDFSALWIEKYFIPSIVY